MNTGELTFKQFLFNNRLNRLILILAAIAITLQFSIFKYFYPYANYIHGDSFTYINAAYFNLDITTHPIGYAKFLRLFSVFNRTDLALTAVQYLFIHCSVLYLLFTTFYFYKPGRIIQYLLLSFMVFNPLFLYLANYVSSDCLFLSLSCHWFGLILWIIHRPSKSLLIWHAIVLFIVFTVRYNALIYPFIALLAFWLTKMPLTQKISGLSMVLIFCGSFIIFNMYKYKQLTGYWQFAPFSGWQLANNALYGYRFVDSVDWQPVPPKFKSLDKMVRTFYYNTRLDPFLISEGAQASTFYMWSRGLPLMDYKDSVFKTVKKTDDNKLKLWASMAPLYKGYGWYIIKTYPLHFVRYFIWPNSINYYAPPVQSLAEYNSGRDTVRKVAQKWFGYKTQKLKSRTGNGRIWLLDYYPILSGVINVVMLFGLICYVLLKGWKYNSTFKKITIITGVFWILNACFTIFSSSVELRFQSFPVLLSMTFALILVDWMVQLMKTIKIVENNSIKKKDAVSPEIIA